MMLKTFMTDLFHIGRHSKGVVPGKSTRKKSVKYVALESLTLSKPMTAEEIDAKYKAGRIAEMSDVHAKFAR
jgi:hypothetical protein